MIEIYKNLFVGSDLDCIQVGPDFAVIHACKTCHQKGVGYRGNLPSSHLNYLIYEVGLNLYLNLVDMEKELSPVYTHPIMKSAMGFIEKYIQNHSVLIHCNQGQSRSPSIGLLYLARKEFINNSSFQESKVQFDKLYPFYTPGCGIELYLNSFWKEIIVL